MAFEAYPVTADRWPDLETLFDRPVVGDLLASGGADGAVMPWDASTLRRGVHPSVRRWVPGPGHLARLAVSRRRGPRVMPGA